jgi:vacuolar-type H+-ATPase subunit E/Vma4
MLERILQAVSRSSRGNHKSAHTDDKLSPVPEQEGSLSIVEGILEQARREAEQILTDARTSAGQRRTAWEKQALRLRSEAEEEAQRQYDEIISAGASRLESARKNRTLQLSERVINSVIDAALDAVEAEIGSESYPAVLEDLITEAALGIQTERATVAVSAEETALVCEELLKRAEKRVKAIAGRSMILQADPEHPLAGQGPVLTSPDNTVAYSNQIRTRLLRSQSEIRHLIYRMLLTPGRGEDDSAGISADDKGDGTA